jgi:TonB family protein
MSGLPYSLGKKKRSMRTRIAIILVALSVGTIVLVPCSSVPWEQSDGARKVLNRVVPTYPELARKMQMTGTVRVEVLVASNGKVKETQVINGSPVLAKAALDALEKWKWEAGTKEKELIQLNFQPQ